MDTCSFPKCDVGDIVRDLRDRQVATEQKLANDKEDIREIREEVSGIRKEQKENFEKTLTAINAQRVETLTAISEQRVKAADGVTWKGIVIAIGAMATILGLLAKFGVAG